MASALPRLASSRASYYQPSCAWKAFTRRGNRVIPCVEQFPSPRPSKCPGHAHGAGLPQPSASSQFTTHLKTYDADAQRGYGRHLSTCSDCDQAPSSECVGRGGVMGRGCPLGPKQVSGSPRPPPLQRTLSVARGSLDKGILVPKISRTRVLGARPPGVSQIDRPPQQGAKV